MSREISGKQKVEDLLTQIKGVINKNNVKIAIPLLDWVIEKIQISHNEAMRSKRYTITKKTEGKPRQVKRGSIYYAKLGRNIGSEQNGYRPVLVVQNHKANFSSPNVLIIPLTDAYDEYGNPKRVLGTHVEIEHPNLSMKSIIKTEYINHISKSRLLDEVCNIGKEKMKEVDSKLTISLGIKD